MWNIYVDSRLYKRMRKKGSKAPHPVQIKQAAMTIKRERRQRLNKTYNKVIKIGGSSIFLAYQFQEGNVLYIKEAKYPQKIKKIKYHYYGGEISGTKRICLDTRKRGH
jgi:hypothetical protein